MREEARLHQSSRFADVFLAALFRCSSAPCSGPFCRSLYKFEKESSRTEFETHVDLSHIQYVIRIVQDLSVADVVDYRHLGSLGASRCICLYTTYKLTPATMKGHQSALVKDIHRTF